MPFEFLKNQSEEFQKEFEGVWDGIKQANPKYSDEKVAKLSWYTMRRNWAKDKDGNWTKKSNASIETAMDEILLVSNDFDMAFASIKDGEGHQSLFNTNVEITIANKEDKDYVFKNTDLMAITSKFAHLDVKNNNLDIITKEDAVDSLNTFANKPIDIDHDITKNIGVLLNGEIINTKKEGEKDYLQTNGIIWCGRFKEITKEILKKYESGDLKTSFEAYFVYASCPVCLGLFIDKKDYCEHLQNRFETGTGRILKFINWAGKGILLDTCPADKGADVMSVGSDDFNELSKYIREAYDITEKLKTEKVIF